MRKHILAHKGYWIGIPILLTALLMIGCSTDNNPVAAIEPETDGTLTPAYPPLTDELLRQGPAAGFRFFSPTATRSTSLDDNDCDSLLASRNCSPTQNRVVTLSGLVQINVSPGDLTAATTISIVAPEGCLAVADFYPHPYQFSGPVEITWLVGAMDLPHDFDYSSLVPFYVTDAGEYIEMPHEWRGNYSQLVVTTDHFSRYIVGQRVAG